MGSIRAAAIALAVGFAVMSVELTAVRLMAPHFGDSAYVWTNVIGVILVALALGAWIGGRAAAPDAVARRLRSVLIFGGVLTAAVPLIADPLGRWLLPSDLPLDAAMGALVRGSFAATLVLFAPPVLFAGMATPMLVTALATSGRAVGRASGHVAAWSTVGSLLGTFATTHLLVPGIGSRLTIVCCAALLVIAGVLVRSGAKAAAWLLVPLLVGVVPLGPRRAPPDGMVAVDGGELESAYQYLSVVRSESEPVATWLQINEGLDSFHSIAIEGSPFTGGRYYDYFAAVPFLRTDGSRAGSLEILSLGAACGTFERMLAHVWPEVEIDSVELDPAVVSLGERHFGGMPSRRVVSGLDARVFVDHAKRQYDAVLVDAYERQIYIPAHVASVEFFEAVRARLLPGGIVAVNTGGRTFDDPVVSVVARTMASVFGESFALRVPRSRNFMIAARREATIDPTVLDRVATDDEQLSAILDAVALPSSWRRFTAAPPLLTDDRPFLDRVQDAALRRSLGTAEPMRFTGRVEASDAEQAAWHARSIEDLSALDAALRSASAPTASLRLYAGDLRWLSHDLPGARAEYVAALELATSEEVRAALRGRLDGVEQELGSIRRADGIALRNTWVGAVAGMCLLALLAIGVRLT